MTATFIIKCFFKHILDTAPTYFAPKSHKSVHSMSTLCHQHGSNIFEHRPNRFCPEITQINNTSALKSRKLVHSMSAHMPSTWIRPIQPHHQSHFFKHIFEHWPNRFCPEITQIGTQYVIHTFHHNDSRGWELNSCPSGHWLPTLPC